MAVDFSSLVYLPNQEVFGRSITVTPLASMPGQSAYSARGIYRTRPTIIEGGEVGAVIADQESVLYIRDAEFPKVPIQGDLIGIPVSTNGIPPPGSNNPNDPPAQFYVTDVPTNDGGESTLILQKVVP